MKILAPELSKACIEILNGNTELWDMSSVPENITVKEAKQEQQSQCESFLIFFTSCKTFYVCIISHFLQNKKFIIQYREEIDFYRDSGRDK